MKWKKFKHIDGYASYWELNGNKLLNGDRVVVKWPDGTVEPATIRIVTERHEGHGGMDESTVAEQAHLVVNHHYEEALVRIHEEVEAQWTE